jgi:putative SOS response-associated peptidase YedK
MCGRTRLAVPPSDLADVFGATLPMDAGASPSADEALNLNCAPTDPILVVRRARDSGERELVLMRWGLVPFYVRDFRDAKPLINARVETVAVSRAFRDSFKKRRCLILADGFYEWQHVGKKKLPHLIQRPDHTPFGMAGLWDRWKGSRGERIETCTIITRAPSDEVAQVHDRMPVALHERDHTAWLDPATEPPALHDILDRAIVDWVVAPIARVPDSSRKTQLKLFASALDK